MNGRNALEWRDWYSNLPWDEHSWPDREAFEECSYRSCFEHLTAIRRAGPLLPNDLPLICVLRNEVARLPVFFDHYKKLGITRFIMIDNTSDDGSRDALLAEGSADVLFTSAPFLKGQSGLYWANGLAHALCRNHWVLRVDADELLVYDGMENHGLADLAGWLEMNGRDRLFAPMRDVYPSSSLNDGKRSLIEVLENDCWFDSEGYKLEKWREGWHITGGPRQRLFGRAPYLTWLSKYPFFRMTEEMSIVHHHYLWPLNQSFHEPAGALLHTKMLGDFADRSERYALEGQHWNESKAYQLINDKLREAPATTAICEHSKRYTGPQSLVRHGLMQPIDWDE